MQLKKIFNKLLGKKTVAAASNESAIKFEAPTSAAQARTFVTGSSAATDPSTVNIEIPAGKFVQYDHAKNLAQQHAATIIDPKTLDIVVLIKERREALHNFVDFLKNTCDFPPSDQISLVYTSLTPTIDSGEHAGKINRNARYGLFKDQQQEILTFFDGSDHSKEHLLNDQKENQKLLLLISWVIALKNFALTKPLEYAKMIDDLTAQQQAKLAKVLVFLAESTCTDDILTYKGTVRSPEFKVKLENAIREWYQGCNLVCME